MRCLFIGGTNDGEWIDVETPYRDFIQLLERQKPQRYHRDVTLHNYTVGCEVYRKETLRVSDVIFTFYVEQHIFMFEAVDRLFHCYRATPMIVS